MARCPLLLALVFLGCDASTSAGGGDSEVGCVNADLIAQCPPAANPILGSRAEAECASAVGGVVQDGEGQATAQCYGVGSCRVMCQFAVPCRCGIESVTREGVFCAPCEGAASCGNGACEGGESPETCPIDCGMVCNAGERRCDGERLQECDLQGRFDTLPCPRGEVCDIVEGLAQCTRDPDIIIGGDAGVEGDAGLPPDDGRLIPGDGTWPAVADLSTAPTPRVLTSRQISISLETPTAPVMPSQFVFTMQSAGALNLHRWQALPNGAVEGFGTTATVRVDAQGRQLGRDPAEFPPVDEEVFCTTFAACNPGAPCPWQAYQATPPWQVGCMVNAARVNGDCATLAGFTQVCVDELLHAYPEGFTTEANRVLLAGGRVLGNTPGRERLVVLDLEDRTVHTHEPVPGFQLAFGDPHLATLSADGRVAAYVAAQGEDQVVVVWQVDSGARRVILPISGGRWQRVALSPDGQVLALTAYGTGRPEIDQVVSLWNVAEERRIVSLRQAPGNQAISLNLLAFSPNGRELAVDMRTEVEIWDLGPVPEKRHTLAFDGLQMVGRAAYSPDGTTLALHLGVVGLWDTATGERFATLESAANEQVHELRFTDDGQRLLALFAHAAYRFVVLEP